MAHYIPSSDEVEDMWNKVVSKTIICVQDDSPNDKVLAFYLGKDVENAYRVRILEWKFSNNDIKQKLANKKRNTK